MQDQKKHTQTFFKFFFQMPQFGLNFFCNNCLTRQLFKPYPHQKHIAEKQDFKGQSLYFNHRISFDTKVPISSSSEGNSYIMVIRK